MPWRAPPVSGSGWQSILSAGWGRFNPGKIPAVPAGPGMIFLEKLTNPLFDIILNEMENLIEVKLVGLIMDPISKTPVMILKPINDKKIIPIWIGGFEANAITMELENIAPPRPMTHDLIRNLLFRFEAEVEKVVVTDIVENTYFAELYVRRNGECITVDCRPSDAVAIALKNKSKIFISEYVYNSSVLSDFFSNFLDNEEKLDKWFNNLSPDDFGNVEQ
jgi:bifunctional DNase/RNase